MLSIAFSPDHSRVAVTLSHPKGNIITAEMVAAFRAGLDSIADNPHIKLITITGDGSDFSFGASIPEHAPDQIGRVLPEVHALIEHLLEAPAVTAAVVRGRCLGGGFELALACDLIFAADDAVFGLPEVSLGVFPPAGAALLPLRIGSARATRAIVTGEARPAREWRDAGLIESIVASSGLDAEVDRWFEQHLRAKSAAALRHAAQAARAGLVGQLRATLAEVERLYLDDLMKTRDAAEGIAAFLQKRPPNWTDR